MQPDNSMQQDKDRQPVREEFEVAYYTKELGRSLQRKLLQRHLADFSHNNITAVCHGEDAEPELRSPLPREDRAG
jgi:hypothetical protein